MNLIVRNKLFYVLSTSETLQLLFAFECFRASGNRFVINQFPFALKFCSIVITSFAIVTSYSLIQISCLSDVDFTALLIIKYVDRHLMTIIQSFVRRLADYAGILCSILVDTDVILPCLLASVNIGGRTFYFSRSFSRLLKATAAPSKPSTDSAPVITYN